MHGKPPVIQVAYLPHRESIVLQAPSDEHAPGGLPHFALAGSDAPGGGRKGTRHRGVMIRRAAGFQVLHPPVRVCGRRSAPEHNSGGCGPLEYTLALRSACTPRSVVRPDLEHGRRGIPLAAHAPRVHGSGAAHSAQEHTKRAHSHPWSCAVSCTRTPPTWVAHAAVKQWATRATPTAR
jgi:hypothetical protein